MLASELAFSKILFEIHTHFFKSLRTGLSKTMWHVTSLLVAELPDRGGLNFFIAASHWK